MFLRLGLLVFELSFVGLLLALRLGLFLGEFALELRELFLGHRRLLGRDGDFSPEVGDAALRLGKGRRGLVLLSLGGGEALLAGGERGVGGVEFFRDLLALRVLVGE